MGTGKPEVKEVDRRALGRLNRRELLKLTPLLVAGAFAVPKLRESLLEHGVGFSDWASGKLFSKSRLAPTYAASAVTPFEKFPYNGYDVLDPEVDLENWTLTVEGKVQKPGEYTLAQVQGLT